jgi:hypothetical protein
MKMKRLTIELLEEAFTNSEIVPTQGQYGTIENNKVCGCAFTALLCNSLGVKGVDYINGKHHSTIANDIDGTFEKIYHSRYIIGFMRSFDGKPLDITELPGRRRNNDDHLDSASIKFNQGYEDGIVAYKHFFEKETSEEVVT